MGRSRSVVTIVAIMLVVAGLTGASWTVWIVRDRSQPWSSEGQAAVEAFAAGLGDGVAQLEALRFEAIPTSPLGTVSLQASVTFVPLDGVSVFSQEAIDRFAAGLSSKGWHVDLATCLPGDGVGSIRCRVYDDRGEWLTYVTIADGSIDLVVPQRALP